MIYRWKDPTRCPYCCGKGWLNLAGEVDTPNCPLCERTGIVPKDLKTAFYLVFPGIFRLDRKTIDKVSLLRQDYEEMEFKEFLEKSGKR